MGAGRSLAVLCKKPNSFFSSLDDRLSLESIESYSRCSGRAKMSKIDSHSRVLPVAADTSSLPLKVPDQLHFKFSDISLSTREDFPYLSCSMSGVLTLEGHHAHKDICHSPKGQDLELGHPLTNN